MHATLIILKQLKYQVLVMKISAVNDCSAFDYKRKTLINSHNYCHLITSSEVHNTLVGGCLVDGCFSGGKLRVNLLQKHIWQITHSLHQS